METTLVRKILNAASTKCCVPCASGIAAAAAKYTIAELEVQTFMPPPQANHQYRILLQIEPTGKYESVDFDINAFIAGLQGVKKFDGG